MKITLTPTNQRPGEKFPNRSVEISIANDDLTIDETFDGLIIPALIAWGYHPDTVNKYIEE